MEQQTGPVRSAILDRIWMQAAREARSSSHDPHHQVGSVAVCQDGRSVPGSNRIPRRLRCDDPARLARPAKSAWVAHAEAMVVCGAAEAGVSLRGAILYSTRFPCDDCALVLVAAGVAEVVSPPPDYEHRRWGKSFRAAAEKFDEASVIVRRAMEIEEHPDDCVSVRSAACRRVPKRRPSARRSDGGPSALGSAA